MSRKIQLLLLAFTLLLVASPTVRAQKAERESAKPVPEETRKERLARKRAHEARQQRAEVARFKREQLRKWRETARKRVVARLEERGASLNERTRARTLLQSGGAEIFADEQARDRRVKRSRVRPNSRTGKAGKGSKGRRGRAGARGRRGGRARARGGEGSGRGRAGRGARGEEGRGGARPTGRGRGRGQR